MRRWDDYERYNDEVISYFKEAKQHCAFDIGETMYKIT